jgi:hypothetical protein
MKLILCKREWLLLIRGMFKFILGATFFTRLKQRVQRNIFARPRYLRWLEMAPLAVQEADNKARRNYFFCQVPCAVIAICTHMLAKHLGLLASRPELGLILLLISMMALVWPVHFFRLAFAAHRNVANTTGSLAFRLRMLAVISFILIGLINILLAGAIGFVVFAAKAI